MSRRRRKYHRSAKISEGKDGSHFEYRSGSCDMVENAVLADRIPQRRNAKQAERLLKLIDSFKTERRPG